MIQKQRIAVAAAVAVIVAEVILIRLSRLTVIECRCLIQVKGATQ